jgi:hypothetical protein
VVDASDSGEALAAAVYAPMDLRRDPLARACLVRLGRDDYALAVVVDHGFADGVTLTSFVRRVAAAYRYPERPVPTVPSFLAHAAAAVTDPRRPASREFWASAMAEPVPAVSFPGGQWKPWWECDASRAAHLVLAPPVVAALRRGMVRTGASAPGLFLAAMSFLTTLWAATDVPVLYARAGRSHRESLAVPGPLHEAALSVAAPVPGRSLDEWVRRHAAANSAAPALLGQWLTDFASPPASPKAPLGGVDALRERRRIVLNFQSRMRTFNLGTAQIGPAEEALTAAIRPPAGRSGFPARNALHLSVRWSASGVNLSVYHDLQVLPHHGPVVAAFERFVRLLAESPQIDPERAAELLRAGWYRDHARAQAGDQANTTPAVATA